LVTDTCSAIAEVVASDTVSVTLTPGATVSARREGASPMSVASTDAEQATAAANRTCRIRFGLMASIIGAADARGHEDSFVAPSRNATG
jgi:hypothetical protein